MRILVAPDSFKGSLSANLVGKTIAHALKKELANVVVDVVPMADGGEGTIDSFLSLLDGKKVELQVTGPTGEEVTVYYGILTESQTVIIEIATIAGLTLVPQSARNPFHLTTYGIGQCIKHALDLGFRKFVIGLGGSATNDGGLGMLQALGAHFKDKDNKNVAPYPYTIKDISALDYETVDKRIWESDISIASDVNNPLCGENGSTFVFGPQKGVSTHQLNILDESLKTYAQTIEAQIGKSYMNKQGAGAAGGLGFALLTLGATMHSGAELIADTLGLQEKIRLSDWVITGEGQTDEQTLQGKLPYVIAKLAKKHRVPTILISGSLAGDITPLYQVFTSMHAITNGPITLEDAMKRTENLLFHKTLNIARLLRPF